MKRASPTTSLCPVRTAGPPGRFTALALALCVATAAPLRAQTEPAARSTGTAAPPAATADPPRPTADGDRRTAIIDACFRDLNELREANEGCARDLKALAQTPPPAPCPPPTPAPQADQREAALTQCRGDLDACTARPCTAATLPGWVQAGLERLIAHDLGLQPTSHCRSVSVTLDAQGGTARVVVIASPEVFASTAAARRGLAQRLPGLTLEWGQGAQPAGCAPKPRVPDPGPTTVPDQPNEPVREPTKPPVRPPPSGPAVGNYQVRYEAGGEAALFTATNLDPEDRRGLPPAAECQALGPEFEQRVPVEHRSLPAFFVLDAGRVLVCEKSKGAWRVEQRRRPTPAEAHLLVKP